MLWRRPARSRKSTCRSRLRLYVDHEHNCVRLHPENETMEDIIVSEDEDLQIQGEAVHVIKALT